MNELNPTGEITMNERRWFRVTKEYVDLDQVFGYRQSLDDIILEIQLLKEQYAKYEGMGYNVYTEFEHFGYDGGVDFYVVVDRPETDKEYEQRQIEVAENAKAKAEKAAARRAKKLKKAQDVLSEREDAERAEYERLKSKFG